MLHSRKLVPYMRMIEHKNRLQDYLGNWLTIMDVRARFEGKPSSGRRIPQTLHSLIRQDFNLCLMLELFDERLTRFEGSLDPEKAKCDYGAYPEAMAFLDAIYLFSRMLLDSAAGVIGYLQKWDTGDEVPKSFNKLLKKSAEGRLTPDGLNAVFSGCEAWFPKLRGRRGQIVHDYETYFIGFERSPSNGKMAVQFSPQEDTRAARNEDLRSYIGTAMAGYQSFIDRLLEYWDKQFMSSHGVCVPRDRPILMGRVGNILWWAHRYGGYRNDNLLISEVG
jgi:hypothetical protein